MYSQHRALISSLENSKLDICTLKCKIVYVSNIAIFLYNLLYFIPLTHES